MKTEEFIKKMKSMEINKEGVCTITYIDNKVQVLSDQEFKERFSCDEKQLKQDRGFGFCACGYPLVKTSENSQDLSCWLGAYCQK
jgi:hypothetical protein